MITSNDFSRGVVIKIEGDIYSVLEFQQVNPARGASFVRTKIKSMTKGTIIDKTFRGGEKLEDVEVEKKPMQYLYAEGEDLVFMDNDTYENYTVSKDFAGNILDYIKEGDTVIIMLYEDRPISIDPPLFVSLKVTYAEPGIKGDTANNPMKKVEVETGAKFNVPLFVTDKDTIKIDTRTGEYVERVR
ncbi:MAG: elongation factor P [Spirochaetota bacterium]